MEKSLKLIPVATRGYSFFCYALAHWCSSLPRRLPSTTTYKTLAAFTYGLPLLLFVLVVIVSYIFIDPSQQLSNAGHASPCVDAPEWRECVPLLPVSLFYYDHHHVDCLHKEWLPKGCLNVSNGFGELQLCQQTCTVPPLQAGHVELKPQGESSHELRQRSRHHSPSANSGSSASLNDMNVQNRWFTDPLASLQQNQPKPNGDPSLSKKLPPKRCRTVTLHKCETTALKPSAVYNPSAGTCSMWQYSNGCYRNKNIFFTLAECNAGCSHTATGRLPGADDCVSPIVGDACDDRLHQMQYFFNPLRSSCENLTDLCLAGRNRFPSYQSCAETCLNRDDSHAIRGHHAGSLRGPP